MTPSKKVHKRHTSHLLTVPQQLQRFELLIIYHDTEKNIKRSFYFYIGKSNNTVHSLVNLPVDHHDQFRLQLNERSDLRNVNCMQGVWQTWSTMTPVHQFFWFWSLASRSSFIHGWSDVSVWLYQCEQEVNSSSDVLHGTGIRRQELGARQQHLKNWRNTVSCSC